MNGGSNQFLDKIFDEFDADAFKPDSRYVLLFVLAEAV
jgi:hypothetical protein